MRAPGSRCPAELIRDGGRSGRLAGRMAGHSPAHGSDSLARMPREPSFNHFSKWMISRWGNRTDAVRDAPASALMCARVRTRVDRVGQKAVIFRRGSRSEFSRLSKARASFRGKKNRSFSTRQAASKSAR